MESLLENKALLYSLLASGGFIVCMITGSVPEINQQFEIVSFPPKVNVSLIYHTLYWLYYYTSVRNLDVLLLFVFFLLFQSILLFKI